MQDLVSNRICIGLLAHVDAGKTTLSEAMMYQSGAISNIGRVDHGDSFLDYDINERNRGITIYSKDCRFKFNDKEIILLDTPGHIDFSNELERAIKALDACIFVLNGQNPIEAHTKTIWNLLNHYQVPTIFFINKMDIAYEEIDKLIDNIRKTLSFNIIHFNENMYEDIATINDELFNEYMNTNTISTNNIKELINNHLLFPLTYGSALKLEGIDKLFDIIDKYLTKPKVSDINNYYIYKVSKDKNGNNLVHVKINGGSLYSKQSLFNEKIDEIRIYNGLKYDVVKEVWANDICVIKGLNNIKADTYYPYKENHNLINPFLEYIIDIKDYNLKEIYDKLIKLNDEDPSLNIHLKDKQIYINIMGNIQKEILINKIKDYYNLDISFKNINIEYKETIKNTIEGVGHFEPKAHYAEVHLLLKPLQRNSGIKISSDIKVNIPDNILNMIIDILNNIEIRGILTNSLITDIEIVLLGAKISKAHTSKNDLFEAINRAIRMALIMGESIILEPLGAFNIICDNEKMNNILYKLDKYHIDYDISSIELNNIISGQASINKLIAIQNELYPLSFNFDYLGYDVSKNQEEIINTIAYDYLSDYDNPSGSIFFENGAGFYVPYDEVYNYMHLDFLYTKKVSDKVIYSKYHIDDEEVKRVFEKSNPVSKDKIMQKKLKNNVAYKTKNIIKPNLLIVDGYNMLYSWDIFKDYINTKQIDSARDKLIDILNEYSVLKNIKTIVVFDAYKVPNTKSMKSLKDNIEIIYTAYDKTADIYIESMIKDKIKNYDVRVASSDHLIQISIFNNGAKRISASELYKDYKRLLDSASESYLKKNNKEKNRPFKDLLEER